MFEKFVFSPRQIKNYFQSAGNDLRIARSSSVPEVIFVFTYDSLIKLAIAVCAKNNLRIKSKMGHHIELLQKLADLIGDKDIEIIGDRIRRKRNLDLYGGGALISKKEAEEYKNWLKKIFVKAEAHLFGVDKLL